MGKRIIVEGPDGAGKTTLIQAITDRYGGRVKAVPGFKNQNWTTDYVKWLNEYLNDPSPVVPVHDRFFYSELVYSEALRSGKTELTKDQIRAVKEKLREEAFLIYCILDYDKLMEMVVLNDQAPGVIENMRKIFMTYRELMGEEAARYYIHDRYFAYNWTYGRNKGLFAMLDRYMLDL